MKGPVGQRIFGWSRQNSASAPGSHQRWHRWSIDQASGQAKHQVEIYCKFKFIYIYNIFLIFCMAVIILSSSSSSNSGVHTSHRKEQWWTAEWWAGQLKPKYWCSVRPRSAAFTAKAMSAERLGWTPTTATFHFRFGTSYPTGKLCWILWLKELQGMRSSMIDLTRPKLAQEKSGHVPIVPSSPGDVDWCRMAKVKSWVIWVCWMCVVSRCHPAQNWPSQAFPYA